jgi:hypothetical protein
LSTPGTIDLVTVPSAAPRDTNRFLLALAAAGLLVLSAVATLNVVVDPRSEFGTRLVPPLVPPYHGVKVGLFNAFAPAPRTLILGSSRMALFPPAALDAIGFGPAFNFGIPAGSIEDTLAVLRYAMERDPALRRVVVGVDYDRLIPGFPTRWPERQGTPLAAALDEHTSWAGRVRLLIASLRVGYAEDTFRAVRYVLRGAPTVDRTFDRDGQMHFVATEQRIGAGSFDFARLLHEDPEISAASQGYFEYYSNLTTLDPGKLASLRRVVDEAVAHGLEVRLVILPLHPTLVARLANTGFPAYRAATLRAVRSLCRPDVYLYDFTELDSVHGDRNLFADTTHPILDNHVKVASAMHQSTGLCAKS